MHTNAKWPVLVAVSIVAIIILSTALRHQGSAASATSAQSAMPDEVEPQSPAPQTRAPSIQHATLARGGIPPSGMPIEPSAEEQAVQRRADIVALDQKLRSEPLDPDWAIEQQSVIRKAIAGMPGDGFDAPAPDSMDEVCRSSMCRISMVYKDEEDAVQMHGRLTLGLGGAIATARTFFVPTNDGGVEMVVFAGRSDRLR